MNNNMKDNMGNNTDNNIDKEVQEAMLSSRAIEMNKEFEWTDENKQRFLRVNEKLTQAFEDAYREALAICHDLENRLKNNDRFIKDYEIEIKITPYLSERYCSGWADSENIDDWFLEDIQNIAAIQYLFGDDDRRGEKPIYLDKLLNWNTEYFGDVFKDDHICYCTHVLLDRRWSFQDIINIDRIWVDVAAMRQNYIEDV